MVSQRADLPFDRDESGQFLPWIIAFVVYLAALSLAGAMILDTFLVRWREGFAGTLTVQVPPAPKGVEGAGVSREERVGAALRLLAETAGVRRAEALSEKKLAELMEPWLGLASLSEELPLPDLIDVELEPGAPFDTGSLRARLENAVPGAVLDEHEIWLAPVVTIVRTVEWLAVAVVALVVAVAVGAVAFATRTGLSIHQDIVDLLHLMGARDNYIAGQFQLHALALGLWGGFVGLLLAVLTLVSFFILARRLETVVLPDLELSAVQWLLLAALPVAVGLIAMLTARLTVLRILARRL